MSLATGANGDTTIATVDAANAEAAHLTLDIQGDTIFKGDIADGTSTEVARIDSSASSLLMASSKKIELGAAEEFIYGDGTDIHIGVGSSGDINIPADIGLTFGDDGEKIEGDGTNLTINSGGALTLDATIVKFDTGSAGNIDFQDCAAGFTLGTPTYNATDTDVDFNTGNKQFLTFGAGNITDLNLIFPKVSGNFVLVLKQDGTGSRLVTNYKAWDRSNLNAASGSATVIFAGGSNPTLTTDANHVDIISFFYDDTNEIAYGVASLDFQF